jgi:signal transduction histidine kinase
MGELELGRAFGPFARFGDPGPDCGAGLGLTICRLLVEALGSKLLASSRIGAGTHLWFDLPARP